MVAQPAPEAWGRAYAAVQRPADAEILKLLKAAYTDANRALKNLPAGASQIRRDQALAVKQRILEQQAEFFRKAGDVIQARRKEAAARAINVSARYDAALLRLGHREDEARTIADNLAEREVRTLDVAIARMTGSHTPLSSRVYRAGVFSNGMLERRINSALARGLTAHEFAAEIRDHVNPNTPGGARYAALRLARTEINNAFHAMAIRAAMLKPWVTKVEWHKSRSHPRPDRCDELDGQLFAPADTPKKPHPQCLCFITPVVADSPEADEEFLDQLAAGNFDDFLNDFAGRHGLAPVPPLAPVPTPTPTPTPTPVPAVRGVPASERDPNWLADDLNPEIRHGAERAYNASNELVPTQASFRIRDVNPYRRSDPTQARFVNTMDRGAYAACSGGHIVVRGNLDEQRHLIRRARGTQFLQHRENLDPVDTTLAHEMGHALTVGRLLSDEQDQLLVSIGQTFGWDVSGSTGPGRSIKEKWESLLREPSRRKQLEKRFGKYAASNFDEFLAEIWCVYSLDPQECDPDVRRVGALIAQIINTDPAAAMREIMARLEREREARNQ